MSIERKLEEKRTIVNIEGLSKSLRLSKRWLHAEAKAGRIPSLIAGNRRLFNADAVQQCLAKRAAKYESPIQSLLESLQSDFANTASPKGSLEIEQLVVDGFLAHQLQQEKEITVRGVPRKVSEFEK